MTDVLTGRELVEKTFAYMTTLSRECRKALTTRFEQAHRGIPFDSVEPIMRTEIESWFVERDRNIAIKHEKSSKGRLGEILMTYAGTNKDAHFKFHVDAVFSIAGGAESAPAYLKTINVSVDKREFIK